MTFDLRETAEVCLMRPRLLHDWIQKKRLVPAVASSGPGFGHGFAPQQLIGLAIVAGFIWSKRGCSTAYVQEVLDTFTAMPVSALEDWLKIRKDAYTEEVRAKWETRTTIFGHPKEDAFDFPMVRSDIELMKDVIGRVERVQQVIKLRLRLATERPNRSPLKARNVLVK
jgi:hypothetical protein